MQIEDHDDHDGRKVWLNEEEAQLFLDAADDTEERIAFGLGLRCGLRRKEIVEVTPRDVTEGPAGWFLRVEHGKGDKYRETRFPTTSRRPFRRWRTSARRMTARRWST